jgi:hypothetical protein
MDGAREEDIKRGGGEKENDSGDAAKNARISKYAVVIQGAHLMVTNPSSNVRLFTGI